MVATELITGMGELVNYIRELEDKNKKLEERAETFRVRLCNRSEELVKALSPWKKEHQDHKRILEAIGELKEENKKLQEDLDDKEHWQQTMVSYMDDGDQWCNFDRWFGENIDEDDKKQEWVKIWMENTEYEDSDEEELTEPESDKP